MRAVEKKMFVDASAIFAIVTQEADNYRSCFDALVAAESLCTSALAAWEAAMAIVRKSFETETPIALKTARDAVNVFIKDWSITVEPILHEDFELALVAHAYFGKGAVTLMNEYLKKRGGAHKGLSSAPKAKLNMADLFHYAVAKRVEAGIIYTSPADFKFTDLVDPDYDPHRFS